MSHLVTRARRAFALVATATALLPGCPAPDAVDVSEAPNIELLYPPPGETLTRASDGSLEFLVVVDIDGLEFAPEAIGSDKVEGQGHYHVWLDNTHVGSPEALSYTVSHAASATPDLTSATEVHVRVSLQHNDHSDYDDPDGDGVALPEWEDIIAYDIVDE